jgi:hypothetical protein
MTPGEKKMFFIKEVSKLVNPLSFDTVLETPDFIVAEYLWYQMLSLNDAIQKREKWFGRGSSEETLQ